MLEAILTIGGVCALMVISQLSPGPDVIFVFRTALSRGFKGGAAVSLGINLGFLIQCIIACTLGAWVMEQEWSRWLVIAAACWLLHLAWKIFPHDWKHGKDVLGKAGEQRDSLCSLVGQGFLCNVLNPKCMLFILGLTLQPISQYGSLYGWFSPALVAGLFVASLAGWWLWSALLQIHFLRSFYLLHTKGIDAAFALLLAFFALWILFR